MKTKYTLRPVLWSLLFVGFLTGCTTVALFDQVSYSNTVNAKVETLALINQATAPYDSLKTEVQNVQKLLSKAYEYDKRRTNNQISTRMWEVLSQNERSMINRYFTLWENQDSVSSFFITEADSLVSQGFDLLLDFESQKDKKEAQQSTIERLINFINQNN